MTGLPRLTGGRIDPDADSGSIDAAVRDPDASSGPGLYPLDAARLARLRPDVIVTQGLCEVCAVAEDEIRAAAKELPGVELVSLRPTTFADVRGDIRRVARAVDADAAADGKIGSLHRRSSAVESRHVGCRRPTVVMFEWIDPPFSAGH